MKKLISLFMSMVLLFSVGAEAFASYPEEHTRSYGTKTNIYIYNLILTYSAISPL